MPSRTPRPSRSSLEVPALGIALALVSLLSAVAFADGAPWRRRRRGGELQMNRRSAALVSPEDWPAEPASPGQLDPARFADAYHRLCGWMPPERHRRYGDWILRYAGEFGEDPFLLAALSYRMGRCRPEAEEMNGIGLTSIPRQMYGDQLRRGSYRYWTREGGEWREQSVRVDRFPFAGPRLARPEENLYFAAAILSVWRRQHEDVDHAFEQVPHRHHVSHFVWGDRVRSDRAEDRILTDRRRMLQYYGSYAQPAPIVVRGVAMGVPLDGWPRVVSSYLGAERDGGERSHRGIDVESVLGEPVRALAGGRVNFAGVDLPGHRSSENMSNEALMAVPRGDLGAGGRYVCVLHDASPGWLRSCYMHLETVEVSWGQQVARGDRIGTVGRTGMRTSAPHLHLELHAPNELLDPSELLRGHLIGRRPEPEPRRRR